MELRDMESLFKILDYKQDQKIDHEEFCQLDPNQVLI